MPQSNDAFDKNVFINCPFDEEYEPLLQAILFCLVYLGFNPRLTKEGLDATQSRLDKILSLINESKYSIHDLSRCQAKRKGEYYRLNMPFELGLDFGCKKFSANSIQSKKKILVLEEKKYRYQASLSDLSGSDICTHNGDYEKVIRGIRNWFVTEVGIRADAATVIKNAYYDFQEKYYEQKIAEGFSEEDIRDYPTNEMLVAMRIWRETHVDIED